MKNYKNTFTQTIVDGIVLRASVIREPILAHEPFRCRVMTETKARAGLPNLCEYNLARELLIYKN